ncbi:MAG TPA: hypothetical protein ENK57_24650 [Polyangiaceae bacterium]|nr:hypothetical protein [Polyangiaceae bacterium]
MWKYRADTNRLVLLVLTLSATGCLVDRSGTGGLDAGGFDSGSVDAGSGRSDGGQDAGALFDGGPVEVMDATVPDAAVPDAAVPDAAVPDAAVPDAAVSDAAVAVDAGVDAGMDAGFDAGVDAGVDAGFDAGADAGVDAGFDASLPDAGFDAGSDASVVVEPPSCDSIYGGVSGYALCAQGPSRCRFRTFLGTDRTCESTCAGVGQACNAAFGNIFNTCARVGSADDCSRMPGDQDSVCVCSRSSGP